MNNTLKAVVIEVTGGNLRNDHLYLRGAFGLFPDDCLGGSSKTEAGQEIEIQLGSEVVRTDIDQTKAIFRNRSAMRRFFEVEGVEEGDLILIERISDRSFALSKASKRGFKYYL